MHPIYGLGVHQEAPLNAEPPPERLVADFLTPVERFYIRTHGSIPILGAGEHRLRVTGCAGLALDLSCAELRTRFPRRTVVAALECAGNRRRELRQVKPVTGTPWDVAAIGNAAWTGVPLAELLRAVGHAAAGYEGLHVAFASADEIRQEGRRFSFGASVPLEKALRPEVLVADEMNGAPLSAEHGFPLRVVVPGYVGARSVKWLVAVTVQEQPSGNHYQQHEYKLFPPGVEADSVDWAGGMMLGETPVNAAICEPRAGATVAAGTIVVRGYAVAGERRVERVEVTADGGGTWTEAAFDTRAPSPWAWRLWAARLALPPGEHEIAVRAWDSAAQTQPEHVAHVWNFLGYVNNAWHRVRVRAG